MTPPATLLTVGHGTADEEVLAALLLGAGVQSLVDIRTAPGSRRHPQFMSAAMSSWLPAAGVDYRHERDLGGFRKAAAASRNTALSNVSFRGYADYMERDEFRSALSRVLLEAASRRTVVMCAETLWWRCHRRLVADTATLIDGAQVLHLMHDGRLHDHRVTKGARTDAKRGIVVYDGGAERLPGV